MDISPSASEGGKTTQQMNRDEAIWNALNEYYKNTDQERLSFTDLEAGILANWTNGEIPDRGAISSAVTNFASKKKHHAGKNGNGVFMKKNSHYGFNL